METTLVKKDTEARVIQGKSEQVREQEILKARILNSPTMICCDLKWYKQEFKKIFGTEPTNLDCVNTPIRTGTKVINKIK